MTRTRSGLQGMGVTLVSLFVVAPLLMVLPGGASAYGRFPAVVEPPDSAYLFAFAPEPRQGRVGLRFAWSTDRSRWHGLDHTFLQSDYGAWGSEKQIYDPFLYRDPQGLWHAVWSVNDRDGVFAHATSWDLVEWWRQTYPPVSDVGGLRELEVAQADGGGHLVSWRIGEGAGSGAYGVRTQDFRSYARAMEVPAGLRRNARERVRIGDHLQTGTVHKVEWRVIDGLISGMQLAAYRNARHREAMAEDPVRFAGLGPVDATIVVHGDDTRRISDLLMGVFFEDINYAADGGIYAELVQNRGFEYRPSDKRGRDPDWNSRTAWSLRGTGATFEVGAREPLHPNNPHHAVLTIDRVGAGLVNAGFDGIPVEAGKQYDFSVFARSLDGSSYPLLVRLIGRGGEVHGTANVRVSSTAWQRLEAVIGADATVPDARLEVVPQAAGRLALDMVSLFPQHTFAGRKNGLRADLAQAIADIRPRFVRFPGGCVVHGDGLGNIYHWKNTIGPLEARRPQRNLWGYHQSAGLGYFEYFLFSRDIGAEPIPVVAAGVPCQNSSDGGAGQQGGIPMCEMQDFVQDVLDLIEWANGDVSTTWGRKRAEQGHPESFGLKYVGIGNEDLITDVFEERYRMIVDAVRERYPEIVVIGTVGPFSEGSDYREGWALATEMGLEMVDEHYYQPPGWYIHNQDYYDRYDRSKSKVYLGEYAAHVPGRANNIESALAEALHLTTLERNGDIVAMASYAPLLAKEGFTQWNPNLIYFDNTEVKPTVGYFVQQLFGENAGDVYIASRTTLSDTRVAVRKRVAVSTVRDEASGDLIVKIVNLLPVEVNATLDLRAAGAIAPSATRTVLAGRPDDAAARPTTSRITAAEARNGTLPAYSLTVLRMQAPAPQATKHRRTQRTRERS
jgi:alpha-L-arabinofuranosidase